MEELSRGFLNISAAQGAIRNVVGCIDGIAIRIACPRASDCDDPVHYMNRKGFYSVNCQAICDATGKFRWAALTCAGSTNDCVAFEDTVLAHLIANGRLRKPYCIFGDAAYVCDESMVTPFSSVWAKKGTPEDVFNFYHSNLRIRIEMAFGVLVSRCTHMHMFACACVLLSPLSYCLSIKTFAVLSA